MSLIESALDKARREASRGTPTAPRGAMSAKPPVVGVIPVTERAERAGRPEREGPILTIDIAALRNAGYLPEEGQERRLADHYRQVKRPLIERALAGTGEGQRLIMVTSALPGDGKTFTSLNLAFSMARERDINVLLVDCDLPRQKISDVLGLREAPGIADALSDDAVDAEALIRGTSLHGLEVMGCGRHVDNAAELLASARMPQVMAQLLARDPRRLVLLDSPPLLASSEARAMMPVPGQTILVVRSGCTPLKAVREAVALLDKNTFRGLVLNEAQVKGGDDYYYSYSGGYPSQGERTPGA